MMLLRPRYMNAVALFAALLVSNLAIADDSDESGADLHATPYRPTVSNPADLPVPRHLEWEAGGLTTRGHERDRHTSVPFLLKYAFDQDWGVLVGGESFVSDHAPGDSITGWGDTSMTLKAHHATSEATALGVEVTAKFPTATHDLGSGHADYTLNGIVSTEVKDYDVDVNMSYTRLGVADAGARRGVLGWAIAASHSIAPHWSLAGELSGAEQHGASHQAQFLGAAAYTTAPTVVLDAGALVGLDRAAPRYGVFAGLTVLIR
jgi:hypothetical protein